MFKDMKMSDELCQEFRQEDVSRHLDIDFNVKVLTSGHWPNYLKDTNVQLTLPKEINNSIQTFTQFYYNKYNNGRMLNWKLNLGNAELKGNFVSKSYMFLVSSY